VEDYDPTRSRRVDDRVPGSVRARVPRMEELGYACYFEEDMLPIEIEIGVHRDVPRTCADLGIALA
jgi:hypothetical protein